MKKIYLSLLAIAFTFSVNAQLTLTKAFNEPVIGNTVTKKGYDSVGVIPKSTGLNQNWNFSSLITNTLTEVHTFTTVASTPSAAAFPTATLVDDDGAGTYTYLKSVGNNYEMVGMVDPTITFNFTNTAISAIWPVTFGYNNVDAFAGTVSGPSSGTAVGTLTTNAGGTGTVTLPGGGMFTNCLQAKVTQTIDINLGIITATAINVSYIYFHASQKFEILSVAYETFNSLLGNNFEVTIKINNAVLTGINEATFNKSYSVYPNPANGKFNVMFTNEKNEALSLEIMNGVGQTVKTIDLGNGYDINTTVDVTGLNSGVYYVKTTLGNNSVVKKLVIQ